MAITNRERVGKSMDMLTDGLLPYVEREIRSTPGESPLNKREPRGSLGWDAQALLHLMIEVWRPVFFKTLGHQQRSWVGELIEYRNKWAHQESFNYPDTYRCLDTVARLLKSVSAKQAEEVERMAIEVQRTQFDEQRRSKSRKRNQATLDTKVVAQAGLSKWRDVVAPHPDVASGRFAQAQFAADLQQIITGTADDEYGDPKEFFNRTHLTQGIKDLLANAIVRLNGQGGDPVAELQTNFGGGKTHSMIALYHAFGGMQPSELPQAETFLGELGVTELPTAHRAVLVGTAMSPGEPWTKPDGVEIHTLWGEMAYQLGGLDGYAIVAANDENGTSPGSDTITRLLEEYSPALILVDEWVAYARQTHDEAGLPGGTFDSNMTFAQALTEAASRVKDCLMVASLPVSEAYGSDGHRQMSEEDQIEVGGTRGRRALDSLRDFFQRKAVQWSPASAEESFEIVRRRLFEPVVDKEGFASRDAVISAFAQMYSKNTADFPERAGRAEYMRVFEVSYPVHPALFRILYEGWGSLERFQRTRGVLRLMAAVIHALWEKNDDGLLIMPGSIPVDSTEVVNELTRYLENNWRPVIERDVDGSSSLPLELDRQNSNFGRVSATRRVARAVYMGSAPLAQTQQRGIEDREVKLGVTQPGESPATFGDALRRLASNATHVYSDESRYWYDIRPSITREAQDIAQRLEAEPDRIHEEIRQRLRDEQRRKGDFARIHPGPRVAGEIPDERSAALVFLGPDVAHNLRDKKSSAWQQADEFLKSTQTGPRHNRNALVFLAADGARLDELVPAVRLYLAWREIEQDIRDGRRDDITDFQKRQISDQIANNDQVVKQRLDQTYSLLLVPIQPDPSSTVEFQEYRLQGQEGLAERASKRMRTDDQLRTQFAGTLLRMELDRHIWKTGGDHVRVRQLWEYFAQHIYLPRLRDESVLMEAIADGMSRMFWADEGFGYADSFDDRTKRYVGIRVGADQRITPILESDGLVVRPEAAKEFLERAGASTETVGPSIEHEQDGQTGSDGGVIEVPVTQKRRPNRFFGSKTVNADRLGIDVATIGDEVVKHLSGLVGAELEIRIDISVTVPDGVPEEVVRIVSENANTLRFDDSGFEEN